MADNKRQNRGKNQRYNIKNHRHMWTLGEKKRLVEALKKYGFGDLKNLSTAVGSRSENDVQWFIKNWKLRVTRNNKLRQQEAATPPPTPPIELWQKMYMKLVSTRYRAVDHLSVLPEVFLSGCEKEKHLTPKDPSEPNFAAIYNYFKEILSGNIPPHLSPVDSLVILQLLQTLSEIMKNISLDKEKLFLKGFKPFRDPAFWPVQTDERQNENGEMPSTSNGTNGDAMPGPSGSEENFSERDMQSLRMQHRELLSQLNPFGIPISILTDENEAILNFVTKG